MSEAILVLKKQTRYRHLSLSGAPKGCSSSANMTTHITNANFAATTVVFFLTGLCVLICIFQ